MRPRSRPRPPLPSSMTSRQPPPFPQRRLHTSSSVTSMHPSWVEALPLPMGGCPAPPSDTYSRPTTLLPRACSNLKLLQLGASQTHPPLLLSRNIADNAGKSGKSRTTARGRRPGRQSDDREPGGAQRSERTSPNKLDSATALLQSQTRAAPLSRGGRLIHGIKLELEHEMA